MSETVSLEDLKKEADKLGVEYALNIGYQKLAERVMDAKAAAAAESEGNDKATGDAAPPMDDTPAPQETGAARLKLAKSKGNVRVKKDIKRKKKEKEVWLKTPFHIQCTDPETGRIMVDKDGDALAIPLLVCCTVKEAAKLIRKYQPKVNVDDEGELDTVSNYQKASKDEIDAYNEEMATRQKFRKLAIKARKIREAKHFVGVSKEEVEEVTGSKVEIGGGA